MRPLMLCTAFIVGCGGGGDADVKVIDGVDVKVMSRNLYLGADLMPAVMAPTVEEIPGRVATLWKTVQESDVPGRMKLIADEIASARPDVIGLQEATLFRIQRPSDFSFTTPAINAEEVAFDFVELLKQELAARGLAYRVASLASYTDVELPAGADMDLRLTDRDAILVREGLDFSASEATTFPTNLIFPLPITGRGSMVKVNLVRGVGRVGVVVDGRAFTFANTHLEVPGGPSNVLGAIQEGQARNLLDLLIPVVGPVVLLGDFNSPADRSGTKSYGLIATDFKDAGGGDPTCCTDLQAPAFTARERIDLVFTRGPVQARNVTRVGTERKTPGGLWPSDHAGVIATLAVGRTGP